MTDRELMQMALDAFESFESATDGLYKGEFAEERKALQERLAQPEYDQAALELCDVCGWKAVVPDECCLNCKRLAQPELDAVLAEREACAKVCDEYAQSKRFDGYYIEGFADGADVCANAIRARGEK